MSIPCALPHVRCPGSAETLFSRGIGRGPLLHRSCSSAVPKAVLSLAAASGPEDVALYIGLVAVAVCLILLLLVLVLVYCRKKEGLDSDVADSSILTSGFQPVSIKPNKAGEGASPPVLLPEPPK